MLNEALKLDELISQEYRHGFSTDLETDTLSKGLNEAVIRLISAKKEEPEFMLEWRLQAGPADPVHGFHETFVLVGAITACAIVAALRMGDAPRLPRMTPP